MFLQPKHNCYNPHCLECVPQMWKLANLNPIPKEASLTDSTQLRPLSLTNIIMRLFEKVLLKKEIFPEQQSLIKCDQFAYKEGTSATDALIMWHHKWLNWLDNNADHGREILVNERKPLTVFFQFFTDNALGKQTLTHIQ